MASTNRSTRKKVLPIGNIALADESPIPLLADLLLAIPGTKLRATLEFHALSSGAGVNYTDLIG